LLETATKTEINALRYWTGQPGSDGTDSCLTKNIK